MKAKKTKRKCEHGVYISTIVEPLQKFGRRDFWPSEGEGEKCDDCAEAECKRQKNEYLENKQKCIEKMREDQEKRFPYELDRRCAAADLELSKRIDKLEKKIKLLEKRIK